MTSIPLSLVPGMALDVSRIGYPDEGLRLTVHQGIPYKFNAEVKLGRRDTEQLIAALQEALANPRNGNMPL